MIYFSITQAYKKRYPGVAFGLAPIFTLNEKEGRGV